ncbi:hypothetical protein P886_3353 [Alteromonadaceae bacterium 2753L.S.0a.02]|nr:hypothetical protein P886_3353 [Alteromonadaceae bacterium 2753L.S.0a.02]
MLVATNHEPPKLHGTNKGAIVLQVECIALHLQQKLPTRVTANTLQLNWYR